MKRKDRDRLSIVLDCVGLDVAHCKGNRTSFGDMIGLYKLRKGVNCLKEMRACLDDLVLDE